jgi:hypothetical protein
MNSTSSFNSTYPVPKNGTSRSISSPALRSELSWQSSLWALVAIALNTMTQSSPYSNSLFSDAFSLLRSSPIFCLADLLVMNLWLLKLTLFSHRKISFLEAVRCFRKEAGLEKKEERVSILTVVLFILGPLPQFIKLNACAGIPWTLAWTWIYMFCYVFTAVTIVFGRGNDQDYQLLRAGTTLSKEAKEFLKNASNWIYIVAHLGQTAFSIWLIKRSLYTHAIQVLINGFFMVCLIMCTVVAFPAICISIGLSRFIRRCLGYREGGLLGGTICICCGASHLFVLGMSLGIPNAGDFIDVIKGGPEPFTPWSTVLWFLAIIIWPVIGLLILNFVSARVGPNLEISLRHFPNHEAESRAAIPIDSEQSERAKHISDQIWNATFQPFFAVAMLVFALAYYWQIYDPADTLKPGWVDVFG